MPEYVGVENVAREAVKKYVGSNNVIHEITKEYVGVNNVIHEITIGGLVNKWNVSSSGVSSIPVGTTYDLLSEQEFYSYKSLYASITFRSSYQFKQGDIITLKPIITTNVDSSNAKLQEIYCTLKTAGISAGTKSQSFFSPTEVNVPANTTELNFEVSSAGAVSLSMEWENCGDNYYSFKPVIFIDSIIL